MPHRAEMVEGDHEEYAIYFFLDLKFDNRPIKKGLYLQFETRLLSFDFPAEWMLIEQVDECEQFLFSEPRKAENFLYG
jgi:hypothetical protein